MPHERESSEIKRELVEAKIVGFFDGKLDEINLEIEEVRAWTSGVRVSGIIERKDQKIASLNKLKTELEHARDFVIKALGQ